MLSLGLGGELIVHFGDYEVVDGPGVDFIVFENPFELGNGQTFAEPAAIGVRQSDQQSFIEFPCDVGSDAGSATLKGCAGVAPVLANVATNCLSPSIAEEAGGDAFDLADIGVDSAQNIRVRDLGLGPLGVTTKGFDLDAIVLINYRLR